MPSLDAVVSSLCPASTSAVQILNYLRDQAASDLVTQAPAESRRPLAAPEADLAMQGRPAKPNAHGDLRRLGLGPDQWQQV